MPNTCIDWVFDQTKTLLFLSSTQQTHSAIQSLTGFLVSELCSIPIHQHNLLTLDYPPQKPLFVLFLLWFLLHNRAIKPPPLVIILNDSFIQNRIASDLITKNTKWVFDLWNFFIESCQLSLYSDMVFFFLEFVSSVSKGEGENRWARRSTCTRLEFFAFLERYPVSLFAGFLRSRCFLLSPSYTSPFFFLYFEFCGISFSFYQLVWFILSAVWACWATSASASWDK